VATDVSIDAISPLRSGLSGWPIARKLGFRAGAVRLAVLGVVVAWLPLFMLSLAEGRAFGSSVEISFLNDYVPHGRYLIALPLLLSLSVVLERRTAAAVSHLSAARLVKAADEDRFKSIVASVARASRSRVAICAFVVVTYVIAVGTYFAVRELGVSNWMFVGSDLASRPTMAGVWSLFISTPLVRFLLLHAFWRFALWGWFLFRVSRLDLAVDAFHADARCGLRFLGETQLAFIPLVAAVGVQLGCIVALSVRFQGADLASHQMTGLAFVALSLMLLAGPLCVFARRAWIERERAEDRFSVWSSLAARHISTRLSMSPEQLAGQLGTSEISSMTDASALFDRVIATRPVPIDMRQISLIVAVAVASTLLPLLTLLPLANILRRMAAILV
jgi:hypothetical protein